MTITELPADDFSRANDLAAENPEKVAELKELFWQEAEKYKVLPLMATGDSSHACPDTRRVPPTSSGRRTERPSGMIPKIYNHSYSITADLVIPEWRRRGVIVAEADHRAAFTVHR